MSASPAHPFTLPITGMTCAECSGRVERALASVPGVTTASVNLITGRSDVTGEASTATLIAAVERAGYQVPETVRELVVEGLNTAESMARVEQALRLAPGVTEVSVNLATERARVGGIATPEALVKALRAAGFDAKPTGPGADRTAAEHRATEAAALSRDLILAACLTLPVVVLDMGGTCFPPSIIGFTARSASTPG